MQNESGSDLPEWAAAMVSALDEKMGFTLGEISPTRVTGSMPVEGNTQPYLMWHGGASAVLVETLGSMGTNAIGHPDRVGVGVDLNVTHLRPVGSGRVHGVARPLMVGNRTVTWGVNLTDDAGELVAVGRLTCRLIRPTRD